ncbi:MAG: thiamine phosphate synthase [Pseudomonadota bacterium]
MPDHRCRLYLITPPRIDDVDAFAAALESALEGGDVACLQVRCKQASIIDEAMTRAVTARVLPICHARDVAVIINDSTDLALALGADGVHLGQGDGSVKRTREKLGRDAIVGATCHDSRHLGMVAGEAGADYVAFGAFFPTETKEAPTRAELELLSWWQEVMELPCVAIGGITPSNARDLVIAGADFLAVSSGVWAYAEGPAAAVQAFNRIFDETTG